MKQIVIPEEKDVEKWSNTK